jgi:hypothetical protein
MQEVGFVKAAGKATAAFGVSGFEGWSAGLGVDAKLDSNPEIPIRTSAAVERLFRDFRSAVLHSNPETPKTEQTHFRKRG